MAARRHAKRGTVAGVASCWTVAHHVDRAVDLCRGISIGQAPNPPLVLQAPGSVSWAEADHSSPSSVEIKNGWSYSSIKLVCAHFGLETTPLLNFT